MVLLRDQVSTLQKANKTANKRKARKRRRIQKQGVLTQEAGEAIVAQQNAKQQVEQERRQDGAQSGVSRQALARCTRCREPGHNLRTCKKDAVDSH
ncbi:hypothetical protein K505DRAFT_78912 [Melanomma pulvis-pyrius CBS 109.77]|uniref:CCHC-type domain-containing protein n=1 Tax=Melanomma pulvis-pyrius CBS 109.77 TaxID=1314802 RepID=A0A6A6X3L4_9PLEO|nr:hypothetical protein K505DRAFT_78912 [Melanomma pulvis-pyrius CBS 109.77]